MQQTILPSLSKLTDNYCIRASKLPLCILWICFTIFPFSNVFAQNTVDSVTLIPRRTYVFIKTNEESIKATVTSFDSNVVMANVKNLGIVILNKAEIKKIIPVPPAVRKYCAYVETGWGTGSYKTFSVKFNYLIKRNVFSFGYLYGNGESPDKPADYKYLSPLAYFSNPNCYYNLFFATSGYVLSNQHPHFRPILKGGLALEYIIKPVFKKEYYMATYSTTSEKKITVGAIINPVVEFPISRGLAASVGGIINVSPAGSIFAVEANVLLGKLRNRKGVSMGSTQNGELY